MTKHIDGVRAGALIGIFTVLACSVLALTTASAQEVPVEETTVVYCDEVDALNYEEEGACYYEEEGTPFCADENAINFGSEALCEYPEEVVSCEDESATNYGAEEACVYDTSEDEQGEEESPLVDGQCEFEGHKYDETGTPLMDWVIGLMKFVTYEVDGTNDSFILDEEATDADGYYCLETNGYDGTYGIEGPYSFIYKIYEILEDGWENVSVEMGTREDVENNTLTVVLPEDIEESDVDFVHDGDRGVQKVITVEVSEENGYIFADAAFHVDFYNAETDNGEGDGENETDTYKVTGYVWNDVNENDTRDQGEESPEQVLPEWTVKATSGETVITDVTDGNGVYELDLPAGTWTICVVLQNEWANTFPNENSACHTITVPIVEVEDENVIGMIRSFFVPTAYAATLATYSDYDFGVVFKGCVTNCGSGSGGGSSGGSRKSGSKSSTPVVNDDPVPQVLGEATSVLPQGAPNTGLGGANETTTLVSLLALLGMIMSIGTLGVLRHASK